MKTSGSIKADTEVTVKSGEEVLATFAVPSEYTTSTGGAHAPDGGWGPGGNSGNGSIMISCPFCAT